MARLEVQHFVANKVSRQYGPPPTADLLGVKYWYTVPPDTEFPAIIPQIDLFTRFFVRGIRSARFRVFVRWLEDKKVTVRHTLSIIRDGQTIVLFVWHDPL